MEGQHIGTEHNPYNEADIRGDNAEQWENTAGEDTQSEWDNLKNVDAPAIHKEPIIGPKDPDVKFESTIKEATSDTEPQVSEQDQAKHEAATLRLKIPTDKELLENLETLRFDGQAIFSDIDGTITDNSGNLNPRAVQIINQFIERGGTFIPVTGRARFQSVEDLMAVINSPFIVMNNGAEIYNHNGDRIDGSELTKEQVDTVYRIIAEEGAIFMQNKRDPKTGEEWLYTNGTAETDQAMIDAGVVDNVKNEEGRIGLESKYDPDFTVKEIDGQNYKIQIMSPDPEVIKRVEAKLKAEGIPCFTNMTSKIDGQPRWVEAIVGTKIVGIQKLIDSHLEGDIKSAEVVGDGANDKTMFHELHNRAGEPIQNTYTAVANACEALKEVALTNGGRILNSDYLNHFIKNEKGDIEDTIEGGGAAITEMILRQARLSYALGAWREIKDRVKRQKEMRERKARGDHPDVMNTYYKNHGTPRRWSEVKKADIPNNDAQHEQLA